MAIVSRSHRLLFIMTPRTACTAVGELICRELGGEFFPTEDILDSNGERLVVDKKHCTLSQLFEFDLLSQDEARNFLKFCAVRNPFDSLVSLYLKKRYKYRSLLKDPNSWVHRSPEYVRDMEFCRTHSFDSWIMRTCRRKAVKRLFGLRPSMFDPFTKGLDMVIRYESIQEDLRTVLERAGIHKRLAIPVVNQTSERKGRHYRSYYSRRSRAFVQFAYGPDLDMYGYSF